MASLIPTPEQTRQANVGVVPMNTTNPLAPPVVPINPTPAQVAARSAPVTTTPTGTGTGSGGSTGNTGGSGGSTGGTGGGSSTPAPTGPPSTNNSGQAGSWLINPQTGVEEFVVTGQQPSWLQPKNGVAQGPDTAFTTATGNVAPTTPPTEADFFTQLKSEMQPVLDAISGAESAAETAANLKATQATSAANFGANAQGLAGSSEADAAAQQVTMQRGADLATAKQNQATALSSVLQFASGQAYTEYQAAQTRNDANSAAYIKQQQTNLATSLAGMATSGITLTSLQQTNPAAYSTLLQYANNDPNILNEMYIQAATKNNSLLNGGQPLTTSGNTMIYGVQTIGPDGKPTLTTQSLTLPFNIPSTYGWTMTKTGTNATVLTDPNNGAN